MIIGTSFDRYKKPDGTITGVPRWPLIVVRFSRPMAPFSTPSRASFSLGSGTIGSVALIEPRVDPVERAVILAPKGAPLAKSTQYELHIASAGGANALAAYDGAEFVGEQIIHFTTNDDDDSIVQEPSSDFGAKPCEAYSVLSTNCTGTFCHGGGAISATGDTPPAMGLNLSFPSQGKDATQATAVGHAAIEVQDPADPDGVGNPQPGAHFPRGMPIIQPNSSAGSYLMYKVLMRPPPSDGNPAAVYIDPSVPDLPNPGQSIADDLRPRMFGEPMPNPEIEPEPTKSGVPATHYGALGWHDRSVLRAWIDEGAPLCPCTKPNETFDCPPPPPDAGVDGGSDAATDTGFDGGVDAGVDAGGDASGETLDGSADAGTDAALDADAGG